MRVLQSNSREYIKQFFIIENIKPGYEDLTNNKLLAVKLSESFNCHSALYSKAGTLIVFSYNESLANNSSSHRNIETALYNSALDKADTNKAEATIKNVDGYILATLRYPLYLEDNFIGFIVLTTDYSHLYNSNQHLLKIITLAITFVFIAIFIFSYIMSFNFVNPIIKIRNGLKGVAKGAYDVDLNIKNRDELGELAEDFYTMKDKIKQQMDTINKEKNKVLELEKQRTDFFNNVTHDLKTPLTTISGYAQILSEEEFDDRIFYKSAINNIKKESQRLHEMVINLLEVSKKKAYCKDYELQALDITEVINEVCGDMKLKAQKYNITINNLVSKPLHIKGDRNKMKEVFINLIDNAIKYGNVNSRITVRESKENNLNIIDIENFGKVIPSNIMNKLFQPFFKFEACCEDEKGSCGLGLYICNTIIEKHGGFLKIQCQEFEEKHLIKVTIILPSAGNNLEIS